MRKLGFLLATLVVLATACLGVAGSANAAATVNKTCFGYTGTFKTQVNYPTFISIIWPDGSRNCVGISPGRHIFDTSPGHPWYALPGGGLADGIYSLSQNTSTHAKTYKVHVDASNHNFCQTWRPGSGWSGSWARC